LVLGLSNDIKVKLGEEKDCLQKISVHMPASKVQEKIEEGFKNVQSRVKIAGFRPGKAPIEFDFAPPIKKAAYETLKTCCSAKASTKRCAKKSQSRPIAGGSKRGIQSRQSLRVRI